MDDLKAAGVTPREVEVRRRRKRLISRWRGVYFVGHPDPAKLAEEWAALCFAGGDACISDRPAAVLYGLLPTQVDPTIHLSLGAKRASPEGLRLHTRHLHDEERTTIHGDLRITTVERTILDVAPTLDDEQLENVVADALRRRLTTKARLERQLEIGFRTKGVARVRAVLDAGPQWTASRAERVFLELVRAAGLPAPEVNRRHGRRVPDFAWRDERVIAEVDGWGAHGDRVAFERDRARDAERAAEGWLPVRFTWRQLRDRPQWVVAQLAGAMARGGAPPRSGRG